MNRQVISAPCFPWKVWQFCRAAKAVIGLLGAWTVCTTTLAQELQEHSVLVEASTAHGDSDTTNTQAADASQQGLEEPLSPVAVATDQQPTPAVPVEDAAPVHRVAEAVTESASADRITAGASEPQDDVVNVSPVNLSEVASDNALPEGQAVADRPAIETARFNGVQPGVTTLPQVVEIWGQPRGKKVNGTTTRLTYQLPPFKEVKVVLKEDIVHSIELELANRSGPTQLAKQLRLDEFRPASVIDQDGTELGLVFPERGVVFSYAADSMKPEISHVLLDAVSSQAFVIRAEQPLHGPYARNLEDLRMATQVDASAALAWRHMAEIHLATGQSSAAKAAATKAVELEPENTAYQLVWAATLAELAENPQAMQATRAIIQASDTPPEVRGQALVQMAQLKSVTATDDDVIELYQQAIRFASELSDSDNAKFRQAAKSVLVDAHLGMAREIARGSWRDKKTVVPLWLERAEAFKQDMVQNEGAGADFRLRYAVGGLAALAAYDTDVDPTNWINEARQASDEMLNEQDDELWQARVHWEAGQAFFHALRIAHGSGDADRALELGNLAMNHLRQGARMRQASPYGEHLVGRLYFHMGAIHAIHQQDHDQAVAWYDKASPLLSRGTPQVPGTDARLHGDALVSMGVSYWQIGEHDRGLELTSLGSEILETAVENGLATESALAVVYGNLAAMHRAVGNEPEANRYVEIAQRAESVQQQ